MIKLEELRVGNYISEAYTDETLITIRRVLEIQKEGVVINFRAPPRRRDETAEIVFDNADEGRSFRFTEEIKGVPLTKDVLESLKADHKFGTVQGREGAQYYDYSTRDFKLRSTKRLNYLHEIQNLYFDNFNEELEINL